MRKERQFSFAWFLFALASMVGYIVAADYAAYVLRMPQKDIGVIKIAIGIVFIIASILSVRKMGWWSIPLLVVVLVVANVLGTLIGMEVYLRLVT